MTLTDKINTGIKDAMKAKDRDKLSVLRAIKSALLLEATKEGASTDINDATGLKILQKLHKQRKDAAAIYQEQGRDDLLQEEVAQANIIEEYLPEQLDQSKIEAIVAEVISKTGANGMGDMGKVMGSVTSEIAGRADGKTVSSIVRNMLSN